MVEVQLRDIASNKAHFLELTTAIGLGLDKTVYRLVTGKVNAGNPSLSVVTIPPFGSAKNRRTIHDREGNIFDPCSKF